MFTPEEKDAKRDYLIGQWREMTGEDMPADSIDMANAILDKGMTPYLSGAAKPKASQSGPCGQPSND